MFDSLQRLSALPEDTLVLPAHDYDGQRASTIGREKRNNLRMKAGSANEFVVGMSNSNLPVPPGLDETIDTNQKCL
jgi:glyoxylase-like metal-dependent hydrolase (beta-lactamase superfamily II)